MLCLIRETLNSYLINDIKVIVLKYLCDSWILREIVNLKLTSLISVRLVWAGRYNDIVPVYPECGGCRVLPSSLTDWIDIFYHKGLVTNSPFSVRRCPSCSFLGIPISDYKRYRCLLTAINPELYIEL